MTIAYTSMYGNTKAAVEELEDELLKRGVKVAVHDLARGDMFAAIADAFRFDRLILATTTYNGGVFPFMRTFIEHLTDRGFSNHTVGFVENGSWAPVAAKGMKALLEKAKNIGYTEHGVRILSAVDEENLREIRELAEELHY